MSEEDLELLVTLDDPEDLEKEDTIATGVHSATGAPPRSFDDFARDYAPAFS